MNVPMASHIGRVWEYQIKTACNVLNVLLDQAGTQLDEKSLNTFMCETEAIVNSCPLTVNNISSPTEPDLNHKYYCHLHENPREPANLYFVKRWRLVQYNVNQFCSRWRKKFLYMLQQRQKWNKPQRNMQTVSLC